MVIYLKKLSDDTRQNLARLKTYTAQVSEEFSRDPVKYSADLVKNYWDLGAAVIAALALTDTNGQIFGDSRPIITTISGAATGFGAVSRDDAVDTSRLFRNIGAFLAVSGYQLGEGATDKIVAGIYALAAIGADQSVRSRNQEIINKKKNLPLETRIDRPDTPSA